MKAVRDNVNMNPEFPQAELLSLTDSANAQRVQVAHVTSQFPERVPE